ncbi:hypothetical protein Bxe_A2875 [Paraburkholderia xenovorans LB400]|uniref:Uncharacterized protein n=1 Tax=Paraburkholderia xenovorans (strain LB400) TaxID=266265 RepID=Q140Z0_PARXL|nr:hypothetical protein Bxe_A2875 [Paraburkholderia xenovorans LB400]
MRCCSLQPRPPLLRLRLPAATDRRLRTVLQSGLLRHNEARARKPLRRNAAMQWAPSMIRTAAWLRKPWRPAAVNLTSRLSACTRVINSKGVC